MASLTRSFSLSVSLYSAVPKRAGSDEELLLLSPVFAVCRIPSQTSTMSGVESSRMYRAVWLGLRVCVWVRL